MRGNHVVVVVLAMAVATARLEASLRRHGFEIVGVVGSHSDAADDSRVIGAIESVLVSVPSLSYRLIVVCRPDA